VNNRFLLPIALLALLVCSAASAAERVGYINVQKIVSNSNMGKQAAAEIAKLRDEENARIKPLNDELNSLKIAFNDSRQKTDASESDLMSMLETIQLKDKQLKRLIDDAKELIARKDRELVAEILRKVDPILARIAKKNGYTVIIKDSNALAYLDPGADLTDEVVKGLNSTGQ